MKTDYKTISELTKYIKGTIEADEYLQRVFIKGEISNFKNHTRGHLYFTLKDEVSRISAVMFAGSASRLSFTPIDGMNVLIEGRISVYEATGNYQIYVDKMSEDGVGNLYLEFEKLKKKLEQEGLFNSEFKKPIPRFPTTIGIITASTGAAVRDIISTIKRRYPIAKTILFPTLVQGDGAKEDIVKAIKTAQEYDLDVIICGRGGGSIEDLWAFNEEVVARAIFESKIPIISAVGHEPDVTIADFVADRRAPTPTGAAEMAVPNLGDIINTIDSLKVRLQENVKNRVSALSERLKTIENSFILKNPLAMYEVKEQRLDSLIDTINSIMKEKIVKEEHNYEILVNKLQLLNPLSILEKGYSVVEKNGKIIKDAKELKDEDEIRIKLFKGEIKAKVKEKEKVV